MNRIIEGRPAHPTGWYGMICWNGLSQHQQHVLIEVGTLEIGYVPMGLCRNGAEVAIETEHDTSPGPRFLCRQCALQYLQIEAVV